MKRFFCLLYHYLVTSKNTNKYNNYKIKYCIEVMIDNFQLFISQDRFYCMTRVSLIQHHLLESQN